MATVTISNEFLTEEFLNDLEIFDFDTFVSQYIHKPKKQKQKQHIQLYCVEADNTQKFECAICLDTYTQNHSVRLNCNHTFCQECISNYLRYNIANTKTKHRCSLCRESMNSMEIAEVDNLFLIQNVLNQK